MERGHAEDLHDLYTNLSPQFAHLLLIGLSSGFGADSFERGLIRYVTLFFFYS